MELCVLGDRGTGGPCGRPELFSHVCEDARTIVGGSIFQEWTNPSQAEDRVVANTEGRKSICCRRTVNHPLVMCTYEG